MKEEIMFYFWINRLEVPCYRPPPRLLSGNIGLLSKSIWLVEFSISITCSTASNDGVVDLSTLLKHGLVEL